MKLWNPWISKRPSPITVIHVERKPRPSISDDAHKALMASLRDGVEYLPTAKEAAINAKMR